MAGFHCSLKSNQNRKSKLLSKPPREVSKAWFPFNRGCREKIKVVDMIECVQPNRNQA